MVPIHDSGTRHRTANSAESINSEPSLPPVRDIFGTSAVSGVIVSIAYTCIAVTVPVIRTDCLCSSMKGK